MAEEKQEQLKNNLQNSNQWMRILYMVMFGLVLYFSLMVTGVIIFIQVLFALITGSNNENLRKFSADLTKYINQMILFLTYNDDRKPFPFAAWGEVDEYKPKETVNEAKADDTVIEIDPEGDKTE